MADDSTEAWWVAGGGRGRFQQISVAPHALCCHYIANNHDTTTSRLESSMLHNGGE